MAQRYDVVFHSDHVSIECHFCRDWDADGGCYGTNPNHGLSLEEAIEECASWHDLQAKSFRDKTHWSIESLENV
jgi:hypothetical protein